MPQKVKIATTHDVPLGEGRAFPIGEMMVALFHTQDGYFAIDDFCPHQGASLACGYVEDGAVACPWHAWRFSIRDGSWLDNPKIKVDSYPVILEGEDIYVEVPSS